MVALGMAIASRTALTAVALLVVAPVGAAVIIAALLLFGVDAHLVFLPGHFVIGRLQAIGFHPANRVGVLTTVALWWAIIVTVWIALRRLFRRAT